MFSLKNMMIETKLRLLIGMSAAGLLFFGAVCHFTITKVKVGGPVHEEMKLYSDLSADTAPPALDFERVRFVVRGMMICDKEKLPQEIESFNKRKQEYEEAVNSWAKRLPQDKIRELLLVKAEEGNHKYIEVVETGIIPALKKGDHNEAKKALDQAAAFADPAIAATKEAVQLLQAHQAEMDRSAELTVRNGLLALFGLGLVIAIAVCMIGITTSGGIALATKESLQLARAIADGNLTQADMKISGRDELAELGDALNHMKKSLHEVIQSIADTARRVASSSEELSATSQQISERGRDFCPGECGLRGNPEGEPKSAKRVYGRRRDDHNNSIHCLQRS